MENLNLKDFLNFKFLSNINLSPDGLNLGFVVSTPDEDDNDYKSNIHIYSEDRGIIQLTSMEDSKSFIWLNSSTILFPAIRKKDDIKKKDDKKPLTVYNKINIYGGEATKAFEIPLYVSRLEVLDDDNYLVLASFNKKYENFHLLSESEQRDRLDEIKEEDDYEVLDEIPFWSNGEGFTNKIRSRLYHVNIRDNAITPITDEFTNVEHLALNDAKDKALLITSSFTDKLNLYSGLYQLDINTLKCEKISPILEFNYSYANYLEDMIVFMGTDMKHYGINENPKIYITEDEGITYVKINDFDRSTWNSVGSDCRYGGNRAFKVDGKYLYFISTSNSSSNIQRISIDGRIEHVTDEIGSVDGFDIIDGKLYMVAMRDLKLQEVYSVEDKKEVQISFINSWLNNSRNLSIPEEVRFKNDNNSLNGWVMKPIGYVKGNKYPGILNIHGGPKTVYGSIYYHEMQVWANKGYFVFFMNPRGSDGLGNEFADIRGKYGTIDYDDLMLFTDKVLESYPCIDKSRIGVTGGSYGGFMTNWIIGHTNRFKAAASQRSISNWISFFGNSDIGYYFSKDQVGATPWSDVDKMWFHSPLKYADKVETPTLFIHSDEDYRCWIPEGLQMYVALKYHGVPSKLVVFKGENHELSRSGKPKHRVRRLEEITIWFEKYLK